MEIRRRSPRRIARQSSSTSCGLPTRRSAQAGDLARTIPQSCARSAPESDWRGCRLTRCMEWLRHPRRLLNGPTGGERICSMSRRLRRSTAVLLAAVAGLLGFALPALADPPARVGRLSEISGTVSFHDSADEQWSPATLNYPVTSGNSFWTEPGAHAEIHVGSTAVHLDGATELDITALDDQRFDATLPQGTVNIRVPRFNNGDGYNIATPRGTVTLASPGTYRISAGTDGDPTQVAVLEGAAREVDPSSSVALSRGEEALLTGTDRIDYQIPEPQPTPSAHPHPPTPTHPRTAPP